MTIMVLLMLANAALATECVLDLTRKVEGESRVTLDRSMTHDPDCPAQSTGRVKPAPTFSVVERLNSAEYSMGGQIVADFRLTNTGNQSALILVRTPEEHNPLGSRRRRRLGRSCLSGSDPARSRHP